MSRPIKKGVIMVEPTRVDASRIKASRSSGSARFRGKAIPDHHPQLSIGKVFVFLSFPFSVLLLMDSLSSDPHERIIYALLPFCAVAVFGWNRFRSGAVASLMLTLVGLLIRSFG